MYLLPLYIYIFIYYRHINNYIYTHISIYTYIFIFIFTYLYFIHMYIYTYLNLFIYLYIYTLTYIHTYIQYNTNTNTNTSNLLFLSPGAHVVCGEERNALSAGLSPRCCGHWSFSALRDVNLKTKHGFKQKGKFRKQSNASNSFWLPSPSSSSIFTSPKQWPLAPHTGGCISKLERTVKIAFQCHQGQFNAQMQTQHAKWQDIKQESNAEK